MFDIGWSEMLLIAVIAIVVIGPKDLPKALRAVGQWVGKARSIAREFQSSVDQMIADAEIDEIKKTANTIGEFKPEAYLQNQVDPTGPAAGNAKTPTDAASTDAAPEAAIETGPVSHGAGAAATVAPAADADTPADLADGAYHPPQETVDDDVEHDDTVTAGARARAGET